MSDPDFSLIEHGHDQPPDEPHPRYVCPDCGDALEAGNDGLCDTCLEGRDLFPSPDDPVIT